MKTIKRSCFLIFIITMAKLHGFARPMDIFTEINGSDEDVVPKQKPKYARQLAMEEEERPDPPVENKTKEDWPDSYGIAVTVSSMSRLYEKYKWNEERIHRLEALIARFARMSFRFYRSLCCGNIFAGWRPDGDVRQFEETLPGSCLQHEDAFVREFQHLPESENLEN